MVKCIFAAFFAFTSVLAGPCANASPCSNGIAQLEGQMDGLGKKAIASHSGGQAVAAERGSNAEAAAMSGASAGKTADAFASAKMALNDARVADSKGDGNGCQAALTKAKAQMDSDSK